LAALEGDINWRPREFQH